MLQLGEGLRSTMACFNSVHVAATGFDHMAYAKKAFF